MDRRAAVWRWPGWSGRASRWLLGALLLALAGCMQSMQQTRLQADDESDRERYGLETVGDRTAVGNAEPVPLGGVGLVVGLEGTGAEPIHDSYRSILEDQLRKQGAHGVKEILDSSSVALVLVSAQLPPGANKGDTLDVEVTLPPGSRVTSLRGGRLQHCLLYNYDFTNHLRPDYNGPQGLLMGHALAHAEGPVLAGVGPGADESERLKRGRIWGGARTRAPQPFALMLHAEHQYAREASQVADRINETFRSAGPGDGSVATALNNLAVSLRVPAAYRLNQPRFLRVVRVIPIRGGADTPAQEGDRRTYRQRLGDDLLDPARTVVAALRLEALGERSVPALKQGLESKHPLVRFCAAEALAYLGSPACGDELARAVAGQPLLRAFGLTAMASLDENVCHVKLRELVTSAGDDETRYGAFRALRTLDEHDPTVRGELLNGSFWVHRIAPNTPPLVHVSSTKRAEIVVFGEEPFLKPPFSFLAGEFTVTASEDDPRCTLSRYPVAGSAAHRQCSLQLRDVLHVLADLGGSYPEAVTLLQQADSCGCLTCRVRVDALPQATTVYDLVRVGRSTRDGKATAGEADLLPAGQDLGRTPNLYDLGGAGRSRRSTTSKAPQARGHTEPAGETRSGTSAQ